MDLTGRVALVIGGTSGLGYAIALGLAEAGADVVATSRHMDAVRTTAERLRALGRRTLEVDCDVLDRDTLVRCEALVRSALGPVDVLVNCAGTTKRSPTVDLSEADWDSVIATNLTGTFRTCQVFGAGMIERGRGSIVNIASLASFVGFYEVAAYTASKSGVAGLTRALAVEWARHGVRVNAIAPGLFPTAMTEELLVGTPRGTELLLRTPMQRFGREQEVVGAAVYLASDAACFVTGSVLTVDGGFLASGVNQ